MPSWIGAAVATAVVAAAAAASAEPAPPPELTAAAKAQVGTYRCKGHVVDDGDRERAVTAQLVVRLDLDGQWLVWKLAQNRTRGVKRPLRYVIYRSFDPATATWRSVQHDNTGGRAEQSATDGATWTGTLVSRGVSVAIRDHQELTRGVLHLWGEYEVEPGVFDRGYDVTCRR